MQTDTFRKNLTIGLMALCLAVGIVLLLMAFRSPVAPVSTVPSYSMSVIGALQPAQPSATDSDTGDACHQGGAGSEVVDFCEQYFKMNHPEVLK